MTDDLIDLLALALEALDRAHTELAQLEEVEVPLPDALRKQLEQHDAMKATMGRLTQAHEGLRERAKVIYREEVERVRRTDDVGRVPVDAGVLRELADVQETIRRRRLSHRQLDDALRAVPLMSDYAGC